MRIIFEFQYINNPIVLHSSSSIPHLPLCSPIRIFPLYFSSALLSALYSSSLSNQFYCIPFPLLVLHSSIPPVSPLLSSSVTSLLNICRGRNGAGARAGLNRLRRWKPAGGLSSNENKWTYCLEMIRTPQATSAVLLSLHPPEFLLWLLQDVLRPLWRMWPFAWPRSHDCGERKELWVIFMTAVNFLVFLITFRSSTVLGEIAVDLNLSTEQVSTRRFYRRSGMSGRC